ncbi:MAG: extracellular solute-binding protein [Lachnospiraceae bacterium]|nr:extracellular solute-binding protein [Lachnospiraceae bacterium]
MKGRGIGKLLFTGCILILSVFLPGCSSSKNNSVTEIEIVQYKPEASNYFKMVEKAFNETHDNIHLTINSPNDAAAILRTRFIREDYPDIVGIGGDIEYSYYVDAQILADVSDYKGLSDIKQVYRDIDESLELVPTDGTFAVPYMANAAGILYNKNLFEQNGWKIPTNWNELITLCEEIKKTDILPFYFGFKDTWSCLAPWNAIAVGLTETDTVKKVNKGETTFTKEYAETAEKYLNLLQYGPDSPFAYSYNDACTAFARGESAMYPIGSYAVPQILSVNPDMNIDSFVMPASDSSDGNTLNSGIDLQFCITEACENKEAAYEVLDFLFADENIQAYADAQNAIPCKEGDFKLASMLDGMKEYIEAGKMADFHDHYYPTEMSADALLQTFLIEKDVNGFLKTFDKNWQRYNRDIIRKVREYEENNSN